MTVWGDWEGPWDDEPVTVVEDRRRVLRGLSCLLLALLACAIIVGVIRWHSENVEHKHSQELEDVLNGVRCSTSPTDEAGRALYTRFCFDRLVAPQISSGP